jgi:predicted ATPase
LTLLFTDIDGSTRLVQKYGDRYPDVLAEHRGVLRQAFARHGGIEVDTQGDAFFVVFPQAGDAVSAAVEAQRGLADGPVRVRMGLHTGTPLRTPEGYAGMHVHRAARIAAAGHGGQVLLSRSSADAADVPFELRDLGEHRLKDLPEPEWIFQVRGHGLTLDFPPLRSLSNTNLPIPGRRLVGRERELTELASAIRSGRRVVTLTGAGGTGKTRLAVQAGLELVEHFPNGVLFVGLAPITDAKLVIPAIARTVGVRESPGEPLLDTLAAHLEMRRLLLILDNLEHVVDAAADVAALVSRAGGLTVLATSREPLRIDAEQEFPLAPLEATDAIELFSDRATLVDPDFEADGPTAEICERLDGLPLAIELAAARVRLFPPSTMLERLERRLPLLRSSARDVPDRQRTLEATIDWSYGLLSPVEQELFRNLAVFAGGCSLDAAETVCSADPDALEALVQKNLVLQRRDVEGHARFLMLATVREFADDQLEARDPGAVQRSRHAAWVCTLAEEAEPQLLGQEQVRWMGRLDEEFANIRAAVGTSLAAGDAETALRISAALVDFWDARGSYDEARGWLHRGLAAYDGTDDQLRAKSLLAAGLAAFNSADVEEAESLTEQSLEISRSAESGRVHTRGLIQRAALAMLRGDFARTVALAEPAAAVAEAAGDDIMRAFALNLLAVGRYELGDQDAAERLFNGAAELLRDAGDRRDLAILQANLAEAALIAGDYAAALGRYQSALALSGELGDRGREPSYHLGMAVAELFEQSLDSAAEHVSMALIRGRDVGDIATVIGAMSCAAGVLAARGDPGAASVLRGIVEHASAERGLELSGSDLLVDEQLLAPVAESDPGAWAEGLAEGRRTRLEQGIDLALTAVGGVRPTG